MKQIFDKIFFYVFTLFLIIYIYVYYFQNDFYEKSINTIFYKNDDIKKNKEKKENSKNLFYSYIFFYIIFFYFGPFCKNKIYENAKLFYKHYKQKRLYDIFHNIIPYTIYSKYLSEICALFIIISSTIFFILKPNILFLSSLLILVSILLIMKCIIGLITLLPDSSGNCTYSNLFGSCNDLLFSGHVSKILILLLLVDYYNVIPNYVSYIYYILFVCMILFILSSRKHYSIDIIFGIIVSLFIFMIYYNKNLFIHQSFYQYK